MGVFPGVKIVIKLLVLLSAMDGWAMMGGVG